MSVRQEIRMVSFQKPAVDSIRRFIAEQAKLDFSYSAVGASAATPPAGFVVDRTRIQLGEGEAVYESASAALRRWDHFTLGWVDVWSPETPVEAGEVVAVMGRALGLWWLNCCRIVYVVNETGPIRKFGFAYGTLPGHVESGEERFVIEWNQGDNSVWYDILAFSRPSQVLIRLGSPIVRRMQKRFGRDSAAVEPPQSQGTPHHGDDFASLDRSLRRPHIHPTEP
ncbi:MAG: DUF1990 family protein, partial [Planctomycetaceae bacterium]